MFHLRDVAVHCGPRPYLLRVPKFYFRLVEFLGRGIGRSQELYLHRAIETEGRSSYIDGASGIQTHYLNK